MQAAAYEEIVAPPLLAGAVNAITALAFPAVALVIDGAPGTVLTTPVPVPVPVAASLALLLLPPLHALSVMMQQADKTKLVKQLRLLLRLSWFFMGAFRALETD
jgi:hypothetical protein